MVQENGAAFNTNYLFRMVIADGTALGSYTRYPVLVMPAPRTFDQVDYQWFENADSISPGAALAPLRTPAATSTHGLVYRLRLNVEVDGLIMATGTQAFKLQYSQSTAGPWSDVGAPGSGSTWRGFDNPAAADGAISSSPLLASSDVAESYEEANPSVSNPTEVAVGERGEWDWVVQDNGGADSTTYYFRMVFDDDTPLDSYSFHPTLTTPPPVVFDQRDYHWFKNNGTLTPSESLAAANSPLADADPTVVIRLRMNVNATTSAAAAGALTFKLQFSTSTSGQWTDVGGVGSSAIWRGFNNPTSTDGALLPSLLLTTSTVAQTYEEANPTAATLNLIVQGDLAEWDWVLENNGALESAMYFFRMVEADDTAFGSYTGYPELTTVAAQRAQRDYKWFANRNNPDPIVELAAQNTPATGIVPAEVVRLRVNVSPSGEVIQTGELTLKLQYAISTGGPWQDVAGLGSAEIWRGSDNSLVLDGTAIGILLLTGSDVLETYEETSPSLANPQQVSIGGRAEWDWVVQNNNAPANTYYFRLIESDDTPLDSYVNYPELATVQPTLTQQDYRWYANIDGVTPTTPLALENTSTTGATPGSVFRLRLNVGAAGVDLPTGPQAFKLQFAATTTGPWTNVGAPASTTIWRGFDNPAPADGTTLPSLLLSSSNVLETYEEANPSVPNPNPLLATSTNQGEWDWVIEDKLAPTGTFYFRMVKSDGTPLDGYTNYPEIEAAGPSLAQENYRWYLNADSATPTTTLAAENTPFTTTTQLAAFRLRMNLEVSDSAVVAGAESFKLQYSVTTTGSWTDVGGLGSNEEWRALDNASVADGSTLPGVVLASSTVAGTYEEENPTATNPNTIGIGDRAEWDWVLQPVATLGNTTYYFRMVRSGGTPLETYTNYPAITTPPPLVLTQRDHRWYTNSTTSTTPTNPLADENVAHTGATPEDVFRLRMNMGLAGADLSSGVKQFKLQFAATTTGPWTDVGGLPVPIQLDVASTDTGSGGSNSLTISHTVGDNPDRILVVGTEGEDNNSLDCNVIGVTYGGGWR